MHDMLVRLYALPDLAPALARCAGQDIAIRRALGAEMAAVTAWVRRHFPSAEAETEIAFARLPVALTCRVSSDQSILG